MWPERMGSQTLSSSTASILAGRGQIGRVTTLAVVNHILTTERLVLRPVTPEDHPRLLHHWTAPDVRRFLFDGSAPTSVEITEAIEESTRDFAAAGYGLWLICRPGGPDPVGTAGLR
jgi:[ribosomal protein S5]-alanine N-acetyltransferase